MPRMYHPELDVTVDVVRESKASIMERSGWVRLEVTATPIEIYEAPSLNSDFVLDDEENENTEEV